MCMCERDREGEEGGRGERREEGVCVGGRKGGGGGGGGGGNQEFLTNIKFIISFKVSRISKFSFFLNNNFFRRWRNLGLKYEILYGVFFLLSSFLYNVFYHRVLSETRISVSRDPNVSARDSAQL